MTLPLFTGHESTYSNQIGEGREFERRDMESLARVCLVGPTIVSQVFAGEDPMGKRLQINRVGFKVIGILAPQGVTPSGHDIDDRVLVPVTTAMKRVCRSDKVGGFDIASESKELLAQQGEEIKALLRDRHHLDEGEEDDFVVFTAEDIARFHMETVNKLSLLLGALALLCLVVGGVVLMNSCWCPWESGLRRSVSDGRWGRPGQMSSYSSWRNRWS